MRAVLASILMLAAGPALANRCEFSAERNLDLDPAGLAALAFELGSSDLHVRGVPGLSKIEVRGKACASEQDWLDKLTLEHSRSGAREIVTPHQTETQTFSLFGSHYAYIDLDVRVPANLPLEVKSRSGDAEISDIGKLDFVSHSGDLLLHHIGGEVALEVHSGDVNADDIGSLSVRHAGSGDIRARNVHGDVHVGNVGSGDLTFEDVKHSVSVESVGSGDVNVSHAGGDVTVGAIGSGDVSVASIGGDFRVGSAGSGDIHHRDVKGKVQIPHRGSDD